VGVLKDSWHRKNIPPPTRKNNQQTNTRRNLASASSEGKALHTYVVGALPIINRIQERMRLADILKQ
jgi:hypothetical protein